MYPWAAEVVAFTDLTNLVGCVCRSPWVTTWLHYCVQDLVTACVQPAYRGAALYTAPPKQVRARCDIVIMPRLLSSVEKGL